MKKFIVPAAFFAFSLSSCGTLLLPLASPAVALLLIPAAVRAMPHAEQLAPHPEAVTLELAADRCADVLAEYAQAGQPLTRNEVAANLGMHLWERQSGDSYTMVSCTPLEVQVMADPGTGEGQ